MKANKCTKREEKFRSSYAVGNVIIVVNKKTDPIGVQGKGPDGGLGRSPQEADNTFFVKICYFQPVLRSVHDYMNQVKMKWKKKQFGGRKLVVQATMLAHNGTKSGRANARPAQ